LQDDIASTATAYADAAFAGVTLGKSLHPVWDADALTVNPYLGSDGIRPFVTLARREDKGVFVLVRTSNPSAGEFQDLVADGRPLYRPVADRLAGCCLIWAAPTVFSVGGMRRRLRAQPARDMRNALVSGGDGDAHVATIGCHIDGIDALCYDDLAYRELHDLRIAGRDSAIERAHREGRFKLRGIA